MVSYLCLERTSLTFGEMEVVCVALATSFSPVCRFLTLAGCLGVLCLSCQVVAFSSENFGVVTPAAFGGRTRVVEVLVVLLLGLRPPCVAPLLVFLEPTRRLAAECFISEFGVVVTRVRLLLSSWKGLLLYRSGVPSGFDPGSGRCCYLCWFVVGVWCGCGCGCGEDAGFSVCGQYSVCLPKEFFDVHRVVVR